MHDYVDSAFGQRSFVVLALPRQGRGMKTRFVSCVLPLVGGVCGDLHWDCQRCIYPAATRHSMRSRTRRQPRFSQLAAAGSSDYGRAIRCSFASESAAWASVCGRRGHRRRRYVRGLAWALPGIACLALESWPSCSGAINDAIASAPLASLWRLSKPRRSEAAATVARPKKCSDKHTQLHISRHLRGVRAPPTWLVTRVTRQGKADRNGRAPHGAAVCIFGGLGLRPRRCAAELVPEVWPGARSLRAGVRPQRAPPRGQRWEAASSLCV